MYNKQILIMIIRGVIDYNQDAQETRPLFFKINHYPVNTHSQNQLSYPVDIDLSIVDKLL